MAVEAGTTQLQELMKKGKEIVSRQDCVFYVHLDWPKGGLIFLSETYRPKRVTCRISTVLPACISRPSKRVFIF